MEKRILVATDGSHGSFGALRLAQRLAERDHLAPRVVTVHPPLVGYGIGPLYPVPVPEVGLDRYQAELTRDRVRHEVERVVGKEAAWPIQLEIGPPAPIIARVAIDQQASLILIGLGGHDRADRWLGTETALRVAHLANVPVLAVPGIATELPSRAVVGMDFSEYGLAAARAAAMLLPPDGHLHLLHVTWPVGAGAGADLGEWRRTYEEGARARMEEWGRELQAGRALRIGVSVRDGDPAQEILGLAERIQADLVAVGSHGAGFFTRLLLGSVCTQVLRGAGRSVLLAPPATVPAEMESATAASPGYVRPSSLP